jgi:hypothetical protein
MGTVRGEVLFTRGNFFEKLEIVSIIMLITGYLFKKSYKSDIILSSEILLHLDGIRYPMIRTIDLVT